MVDAKFIALYSCYWNTALRTKKVTTVPYNETGVNCEAYNYFFSLFIENLRCFHDIYPLVYNQQPLLERKYSSTKLPSQFVVFQDFFFSLLILYTCLLRRPSRRINCYLAQGEINKNYLPLNQRYVHGCKYDLFLNARRHILEIWKWFPAD